jgi:ribosomal protein L30/L7E
MFGVSSKKVQRMPLHPLSLDTLKDLDMGKAHEAFNVHVRRVAQDCLDRPGDPKPRTVNMQITFIPILDEAADCSEVKAAIQVTSKIPSHRTKVYSFGLRRNGTLVFSEDSPTNVAQNTIFDGLDDEGDAE